MLRDYESFSDLIDINIQIFNYFVEKVKNEINLLKANKSQTFSLKE